MAACDRAKRGVLWHVQLRLTEPVCNARHTTAKGTNAHPIIAEQCTQLVRREYEVCAICKALMAAYDENGQWIGTNDETRWFCEGAVAVIIHWRCQRRECNQ